MDGYIQIGVTALRDPVTREPLEAVPLYIRAEDARKVEAARADDGPLIDELAEMFGKYAAETEAGGPVSRPYEG